ncbi:MAG: hypothetical protein JXR37_22745 [Kiritimatiellae bacterium]|nr:hypothetical protein [Kiritimatiellia bacterium]
MRCGIGLAVALFACGAAAQDADRALSIEAIRAYAEAEVKIERLRKQAAPDWAAIRAEYAATQPVVKRIDAACGTSYAREIDAAFAQCTAGVDVKVHQQVLAKGLQHVTVLAMERELDALTAGRVPDTGQSAERIRAYFEGIRPTFTRRDKDYFEGNKTLEAAAEQALAELQTIAGSGQGEAAVARRALDDAVARTYALSLLYEIEEIEKLRDSDRPACAVKVKEAQMFFRIVKQRIERRSPQSAATIAAMLQADYDKMSAATLRAALEQGLAGIRLQ